ncbi:MAG: DMT family transporter [Proteobacteria bacterium]|nr:DMT family transporter [Pseudomonadota bacterium]
MIRTVALTSLAMVAFATNSVLARLALGAGAIDAAGYTGVRLAAGAVALVLIVTIVDRTPPTSYRPAGSWPQAAALFGYAIAFSIAYLALGAAVGAIILFGSVQLGMVGRAVMLGDRPGPWEWAGLIAAFAALVYLVSPGVSAPPLWAAALMAFSGLCWAAYSLLGRGSTTPLADTTGNFVRCLPIAIVLIAAGLWIATPAPAGLAYAIASGAIASGIGYAIWYAALPGLSRVGAASVQLTVPAIAAAGAVLFIGEPLTPRLIAASVAIIGGIAVTIVAGERRRSAGARR